ncbi:MAG: PA14 domain-containing protein, partial [Planctomycetes bacterium]|nr:PA14 domain-containing protein [Planctomycetota bacterium]
DGLAARSGAQRARSARSAVLVEADRAWRGGLGGARPGLLARFYRGPEPAGTPVRSDTTPPVVHADPPDLGVPWSACWQGEIELPAAGEWTFAATADDAVALAVDGQELLPAGAWTRQAPTEYRGSRQLAAGWHRLELRYNQTGGGMFLEAQAGRGGALRPLTAYPLRHRPGAGGTGTAELITAMASLPPVDLAAIEGELAAALAGAGDSASAAAELVGARALPEDPALPDDLAAAARRCRPKGAPAAWDLATVLDGAAAAADAAGRIDGLAARCRQRLDQALAALPGEGPTARLEHLLAAKAPSAELRTEQAAVAQRWRAQPASPEQRLALLAAAAALDGARQEHELHAAIDRARQQVRRATLDGLRADALALAAARPAGAAEEEAARTAALAIARTLERAGLTGEARDLRAAGDAAVRAERARALGQPAGPPPAVQAAELLDARAAALEAAGTASGQQALAAQELAAVQAALRAADPALAALQQRAAQAADDGA